MRRHPRKLKEKKEMALKMKTNARIRLAVQFNSRYESNKLQFSGAMASAGSSTSVQKCSTRVGYTVFILVAGRLETVPILREIYNNTSVIAAKTLRQRKEVPS
jgi:hypothetical protein